MKLLLAIFAFGAAFGFVLAWARLDDPEVIRAMLMLREPDVFLLMGLAIGVASLGVHALRAGRWRALIEGNAVTWRTLAPTRDHAAGSILFGVGWGVANSCPGPVAVQIGRGEWSGLFTAAGMLLGIALRDAWRARAATPVESAASAAASAERAVLDLP